MDTTNQQVVGLEAFAVTGRPTVEGQWRATAKSKADITALSVNDLTPVAPILDFDNSMLHLATSNEHSMSTPIPEDTLGVETPASDTYDIPFRIKTKRVYICTFEDCNKEYG